MSNSLIAMASGHSSTWGILLFSAVLLSACGGGSGQSVPGGGSSSSSAKPSPTPTPTSTPSISLFGSASTVGGPDALTVGADGNMWFTDTCRDTIGKITTSGVITEYPGLSAPADAIASDTAGNLWFTEPGSGKIGKMTTSGVLTEYGGFTNAPTSIAFGPDGNMWFVESGSWGSNEGRVGAITPSGTSTEYGGTLGYPTSIVSGPNSELWVTESYVAPPTPPAVPEYTGQVDTVTTSGVVTAVADTVGTLAEPYMIGVGPNSTIVSGSISGFGTTASQVIDAYPQIQTLYQTDTALGGEMGSTFDEAGRLWVNYPRNVVLATNPPTNFGDKGFDRDGSMPQAFPGSTSIVLGPDRNIWFSIDSWTGQTPGCTGGQIGKIVPPG